MFNCQVGNGPLNIWGFSVEKLRVTDWSILKEKMEKRLACWKSGTLSIGGRVTLLNACLSVTPVYHMSMHLLPKTNLVKLDKIIRRFIWQGGSKQRKYHLIKWPLICKPKMKGGREVKNLALFNISLMCKRWWRLETEPGLWQDIIRQKYLRGGGIYNVTSKPADSSCWKDLLQVRGLYLQERVIGIGNGRATDFWGDSWCGHRPFSQMFPRLFEISNDIGTSVAELAHRRWQLSFRRWLDEQAQDELRSLRDKLMEVGLNEQPDLPIWKWSKSEKFTVKPMYDMLTNTGPTRSSTHLWKARIPLKIKIWLWLIWHNAIATKDNVERRHWKGDSTCRFCYGPETIHHLFFLCPAAKYTWGVVGTALGLNTRPTCFSQFFW